MFSTFSEAMNGLSTIRSFTGHQKKTLEKHYESVDLKKQQVMSDMRKEKEKEEMQNLKVLHDLRNLQVLNEFEVIGWTTNTELTNHQTKFIFSMKMSIETCLLINYNTLLCEKIDIMLYLIDEWLILHEIP